MGANSLSKTVTRQRRDCYLNPGPSAPESSTLTIRLPSHPWPIQATIKVKRRLNKKVQRSQTGGRTDATYLSR